VQLLSIGDLNRLPNDAKRNIQDCIAKTSSNTGLKLVIALSYSARWEIIQAVKNIAQSVKNEEMQIEQIDEQVFSSALTTKEMPDPDLLIRTSGELRISNFLLWQLAYAELYFTDCLWPEFTKEEFYKAIVEYQGRERRFGKTSEQI
jgi:undecaprenyl diphosphate synthase